MRLAGLGGCPQRRFKVTMQSDLLRTLIRNLPGGEIYPQIKDKKGPFPAQSGVHKLGKYYLQPERIIFRELSSKATSCLTPFPSPPKGVSSTLLFFKLHLSYFVNF